MNVIPPGIEKHLRVYTDSLTAELIKFWGPTVFTVIWYSVPEDNRDSVWLLTVLLSFCDLPPLGW